MERITGLEPVPSAWKAEVLPIKTPYPHRLRTLCIAYAIDNLFYTWQIGYTGLPPWRLGSRTPLLPIRTRYPWDNRCPHMTLFSCFTIAGAVLTIPEKAPKRKCDGLWVTSYQPTTQDFSSSSQTEIHVIT